MKSFILVICFAFSAVASAQDNIALINKAANQACIGNPDQESCKKAVIGVANFSMTETIIFAQSCLNNISDKDKEMCSDLDKFLSYLHESGK